MNVAMEREPEIVVRDLHVGYGEHRVLCDLNLEVGKGHLLALVGPNGAGKSTLLKAVSGYLKPSCGEVLLGGLPVQGLSDQERGRAVSYTGDEPDPAFDFTVEETVAMGLEKAIPGDDAVDRATVLTGVHELKDRAITSLSSGERQRVYIARALAQDARVLLFDEPTAHLDMAFELQIMDLIESLAKIQKKTVLVVLHDINLALRYAKEVVFLKGGSVAYRVEPSDVTPGIIRCVYNVDAKIVRHPIFNCPLVLPVKPLL